MLILECNFVNYLKRTKGMADPLEVYSIFPTLCSYVFILVTINLTEILWQFRLSSFQT